ncbi:hypothetical protein PRIPAC_81404 [Pristionchus pacificus]|uniref:G protein-coupled receptor n=1 Tax=Pristionchus pacificus TaxID=54126 RepID=A0A2A6CLS6_PRIPA|nr:hypothetical protein PRIPAC_81404 [Pristionchus pacificus]|eukprot:PDM79059.1 G protein-coupled receptor [Pristionchus pacificus]
MVALSGMGFMCNLILLLTTVRSKSLRRPCNILIGSCALFDMLNEIGTLLAAPQVYLEESFSSRACVALLFLPGMGVVAGSFTVLSISIDRFLAISAPDRYRNMSLAVYLTIQYLSIFFFCAYNAILVFSFYRDRTLVSSDDVRFSLVTAAGIPVHFGIAVKLIVYYHTRQLSRGGQELARLFRAIVLVTTMFDLGGWAITQGSAAMLIAIDMADNYCGGVDKDQFADEKIRGLTVESTLVSSDDVRFSLVTAAGIPVHFGIAVKLIVYYHTRYFSGVKLCTYGKRTFADSLISKKPVICSSDYRDAVRRQFRRSGRIVDSATT